MELKTKIKTLSRDELERFVETRDELNNQLKAELEEKIERANLLCNRAENLLQGEATLNSKIERVDNIIGRLDNILTILLDKEEDEGEIQTKSNYNVSRKSKSVDFVFDKQSGSFYIQ